jgi:cell division protease FtsH
MQLPTDDKYTHSKSYLKNTICILYGGRIAEKIIFDEITTGAGNDIERASGLARKMVCEWGMSDDLGALTYGKKEEQIFLGREIGQNRDFSEDTSRKIDIAVRKFIDEAMDTVTILLEEHRDILTMMAEELLEKETIVLTDIERMVEELRPGKYTSRMKKATKNEKQAAPKQQESDAAEAKQSAEAAAEEVVEEKTATDEQPAGGIEKSDDVEKVSDDDVGDDAAAATKTEERP